MLFLSMAGPSLARFSTEGDDSAILRILAPGAVCFRAKDGRERDKEHPLNGIPGQDVALC